MVFIAHKIFCTYLYIFSINTEILTILTLPIWKEHIILAEKKEKDVMVLDQKWKLKVEESNLQEDEKKEENLLPFN